MSVGQYMNAINRVAEEAHLPLIVRRKRLLDTETRDGSSVRKLAIFTLAMPDPLDEEHITETDLTGHQLRALLMGLQIGLTGWSQQLHKHPLATEKRGYEAGSARG